MTLDATDHPPYDGRHGNQPVVCVMGDVVRFIASLTPVASMMITVTAVAALHQALKARSEIETLEQRINADRDHQRHICAVTRVDDSPDPDPGPSERPSLDLSDPVKVIAFIDACGGVPPIANETIRDAAVNAGPEKEAVHYGRRKGVSDSDILAVMWRGLYAVAEEQTRNNPPDSTPSAATQNPEETV